MDNKANLGKTRRLKNFTLRVKLNQRHAHKKLINILTQPITSAEQKGWHVANLKPTKLKQSKTYEIPNKLTYRAKR